jgi:hypothetical protein
VKYVAEERYGEKRGRRAIETMINRVMVETEPFDGEIGLDVVRTL